MPVGPESGMTEQEAVEVAKHRQRVRVAIQTCRHTALREIAALKPDQAHLAPEIARSALTGPRAKGALKAARDSS